MKRPSLNGLVQRIIPKAVARRWCAKVSSSPTKSSFNAGWNDTPTLPPKSSSDSVLKKVTPAGSPSSKTMCAQFRRVRAPAFLTLAFAPGECAQVDWGCAGSMAVESTRRRLSFFVMVLCYSRFCYLEFSLGEATEHFLSAHQNAFQFLGGVPLKVLIDNPKTAVLLHPSGEKPLFHPRYLDFAAHYGFEPRACN